MSAKKAKAITSEELKQVILEQEPVQEYQSDRFAKIEHQVKDALGRQATQEVLYDITIGALVLGASDIHYEVFEDYVLVRFRIDGVLVDIFRLSYAEYKKIVERLKYAANLKLNISNIPQDGKYSLKLEDGKKIDIRVSTLPIHFGENIVCRILDSQ